MKYSEKYSYNTLKRYADCEDLRDRTFNSYAFMINPSVKVFSSLITIFSKISQNTTKGNHSHTEIMLCLHILSAISKSELLPSQ